MSSALADPAALSLSSLSSDVQAVIASFLGARSINALGATCASLRCTITGVECNRIWRDKCLVRWGARVLESASSSSSSSSALSALEGASSSSSSSSALSFRAYYLARSSRWLAPASPFGLVQELYAADPWRLIASCVLCSRTSGGETIRGVIEAFFEAYPTPSSVLAADVADLGALLLPLGLHRELTIARTAAGFLAHSWTVGGKALDLYGCGAFVNASWRVFCGGEAVAVAKASDSDATVRAYASHVVKKHFSLLPGAPGPLPAVHAAGAKGGAGGKGSSPPGGNKGPEISTAPHVVARKGKPTAATPSVAAISKPPPSKPAAPRKGKAATASSAMSSGSSSSSSSVSAPKQAQPRVAAAATAELEAVSTRTRKRARDADDDDARKVAAPLPPPKKTRASRSKGAK